MRLLADDLHFPGIGCCKRWTFEITDVANFHLRHHVQREDRLRLRVLQHAFFHHQRGPACLARRRTFFRRLKDELDRAWHLTLHRGEDAGNAELHGGVDIVAAGVHHSDVLAEERCPDLGGERKRGLLGYRQRIHVGADGDHRPGLPPLRIATTPVRATPVWTSRPSLRRYSATSAAVFSSRFESSGF